MNNNTYKQYIEKVSISTSYAEAVESLLLKIKQRSGSGVIRILFFGRATSNAEYNQQKATIASMLDSHFEQKPLWGYVIQRPFDCDLVAEVTLSTNLSAVKWASLCGVNYLTVTCNGVEELLIDAIASSTDKSISEQSFEIFEKLQAVLDVEGYRISDIVRQWNYIERIVDFEGECQHYQIFNDARSHFYSHCEWISGYPAATGIGMQYGGVIVEVNAVKSAESVSAAIDNNLQIAAHEYSQDVLIGEIEFGSERTTPKFERGKMVDYGDAQLFYISGTAAIRGEESVDGDSAIAQTVKTLENIDNLVSPANRAQFGGSPEGEASYKLLRVYIKEDEDAEVVIDYMNQNYPGIDISYIKADVCRCELLIEIEGIAIIK